MRHVLSTITLLVALAGGSSSVTAQPAGGPLFHEPPEIVSANGVLTTTFTADFAEIEVAGHKVRSRVYNGLYVPPTLRVRPGDTIRLKLVNRIDQSTNLHFHGMNVSPLGNSDNVFVHVMPGATFDYEVAIPKDHPAGLYWYHSHAHGTAQFQVTNGLSGALIVDGLLDPFPELKGIPERLLLLKHIEVKNGQVPQDLDLDQNIRTLNGLVNPTLRIQPGETQLWRIGNIGADMYYRLKLDGHLLHEVARDGNRHNQVVTREEILVPPSSRVEVLVQGGPGGSYALRSLVVDTGPQGDSYKETTLATLVSEGAGRPPVALPASFPPVEDLRGRPITNRRTLVFSETVDGNTFFINGRQFDEQRVDTTVKLGDVEEWTIRNVSGEVHVFHIHQPDFQVTEVNGIPQPFVGRQDTAEVAYRTDRGPGEVKILVPFTDPIIIGKFVYHCHILEHEDGGMMAVIEVVR